MSKVQAHQWLFLGVALLLIGSAIGWNLYAERNAIDARERERLATQAKVIAENLGRQLLATNSALDSIRADLPFILKDLKDGKAQLNRRLQAMCDAMTGVRTIVIMNADGESIASNRKELIGRDFREGERFNVVRRSANLATLHVSPPYRTPLGVYAIGAGKMVVGDRGEFAGVILAILDPDYFKTLLASVRYTSDMWTSIAHADAKLFIFEPARDGTEEMDLAQPGSFYTRHRDSGQQATVMTGIVYATGEERMMAQRTIKPANVPMDKALLLAVSRDLPSVFALWRKAAYQQAGLFLLLALTAGAGLLFHLRRQQADADLIEKQEAERNRAELALRSMASELTEAQHIARIGSWVWDAKTDVTTGSDELLRIFGFDPATQTIPNFQQQRGLCYPVEDWEQLSAAVSRTTDTGVGYDLELRGLRTGTQFWIRTRSEVVRDANGQIVGLHGTVQDITDRKRAESEMTALRTDMEQLLRWQVASQTAAALAHEVNQPLAAISAFCEAASRILAANGGGVVEPTEQCKRVNEVLQRMTAESERAGRVVRQLLESLRRPDTARVATALAPIMHESVSIAKASGFADCNVIIDCPADLPPVRANRLQLEKVLLNLISNGVEAMREMNVPLGRIWVSATVGDGGTLARITVRDEGPGVDAAMRQQIFHPFVSGKKGGMGIGLAICRTLVEANGGKLSYEVDSGPGATFSFTLPFAR